MAHSPDIQKRAFLWVLAFLLILGGYVLWPFFDTLILSVVLAVLFYPLHEKFLKWTHGRKGLASSLSLLAVFILSIVPIVVLVTMLTAQLAGLVQNIPQPTFQQDGVPGLVANWKSYLIPLMMKVENFLGVNFDIAGLLAKGIQKVGELFAKYSPKDHKQTANFFIHLFILLIVLFYLFCNGPELFEKLLWLSPVKDQYERKMAKEIQTTIYGVFYGSFLTSLIQAILAGIGYYFAGISGVLVWSTITFFVSFIPLIGTGAIILPLALSLFLREDYGHGIFLLIYGIAVIGSSDNLLRPLLIRSNIPQILLFLSLFGGMAVFGPTGVLLGPIIMALLVAVLRIYEHDYLKTK